MLVRLVWLGVELVERQRLRQEDSVRGQLLHVVGLPRVGVQRPLWRVPSQQTSNDRLQMLPQSSVNKIIFYSISFLYLYIRNY